MPRISPPGGLPAIPGPDSFAPGRIVVEPISCLELRIEGRVQGVGYRWSAAARARQDDLAGWVRNEPDGSVLCRVAGSPVALEDFVRWCEGGPPAARVQRVVQREIAMPGDLPHPFQLRH